MNKVEIKKLFWKLVDGIEYCSDTVVENEVGVIVERGMMLSNDYSIMFGLDDGAIRIYNKEHSSLIAFTEESEILFILKELFESLEITKEAPEIPAQEQPDYTTEYRIDTFSRLILTTDKRFYDDAINNYNGIPIVMVGNFSEAEEIYLSQFGQRLYLVQIPLDK
ncbi:hypothetical protein FDE98_16695 [Clostridium sporogenes]|uniref:Uncharacterized protein n=1 Tax=Clostridium sporogenes TaxID=1509 RepID=A0A7X5PCU6_CLOSG|nr:hypothetical protein [Clostridium sporogenes]AJD30895.1 hypothetical protein T258_1877 [Clostridium botulinum Prevot_594]MBY7016328.1 hypothetical protein [Clostridium sporogenes]NFQ18472.1 hypothetical protein [Clostridium sporogenes]NFQ21975.1 hypothetical protein [Clostridium sporogenes]NFQ28686.1 hypothetical protein [Clostridium sporogenes]